MRRLQAVFLSLGMFGMAGCASPTATEPAPIPVQSYSEKVADHLEDLEERTRDLERRVEERPPEDPPEPAATRLEVVTVGASPEAAAAAATADARRMLYSRVSSWSDTAHARARAAFFIVNPAAFSSHVSIANDAVIECCRPMVEVERRADGLWTARAWYELEEVQTMFRDHLLKADPHVHPSRRNDFQSWCRTVEFGVRQP